MQANRREFLIFLGAVTALADSEDVPLFKTGVSLVRVDARVTAPDGTDVAGLTAADFIIFDEGERQPVRDFSSESSPVEIALVLDVSPSMRKSLADMAARAGDALDRLRSGDRVGVLLFAERTRWLQPFTNEVKPIPMKIIHSVFEDTLGRTTFLNEAVLEAARALRHRTEKARRAVIVVTDNEVFRNRVTDEEVLRQLHAADVLVSAILLPGENQPPNRSGVLRYVQETGGDAVAGDSPERALSKVLGAAFTRYTLEYTAPGGETGSFRRIRVELSESARRHHPGAVVLARSGYDVGR